MGTAVNGFDEESSRSAVHRSAEIADRPAIGDSGVVSSEALEHGWEEVPPGGGHPQSSRAGGWYAHGADWAQAVDFTVIATFRCDVNPIRLVAAYRTHRRPWPVMIDRLNNIGLRYPGPVAHDATGGGTVVAEYVKLHDVIDFQMNGRQRRELFINYVAALERREIKALHRSECTVSTS